MNLYRWFGRFWLSAGYLFLYVPIVVLVVFSFNSARQDMVWSGFSLRWYHALGQDTELIEGFILSLKIALLTGIASVFLGIVSAYALVHYQKFPGRLAYAGMVNAPLVMPEVIIGLSLLLALVWVQKELFPSLGRGMFTIWMGHIVLGMAYASVIIQSRLKEMNKSLEEAAMDLGCKPHQVFCLVTLPNITQAIVSAFLLTFTVSMDDVVTTQFLSGPGSSPMPIVIFSRARLGLDPRVNAVAAITILVVSIGLITASVYLARRERRYQQDQQQAFSCAT
jgi:putrescine transport system permease protein